MKVTYDRGALRDIGSIHAYIAKDDPATADRVIARIWVVVDRLSTSPYLGRPGPRDVRFLSVAGLPYIVIYRLRSDSVQIVAIFHTARNRRF